MPQAGGGAWRRTTCRNNNAATTHRTPPETGLGFSRVVMAALLARALHRRRQIRPGRRCGTVAACSAGPALLGLRAWRSNAWGSGRPTVMALKALARDPGLPFLDSHPRTDPRNAAGHGSDPPMAALGVVRPAAELRAYARFVPANEVSKNAALPRASENRQFD